MALLEQFYKGRDTHRDNTIVAMKKLHKLGNRRAAISTEAVRWHYLKEKIIHDHIVKVHAVKYFNSAMWITMEYCDLGDLNDLFRNYGYTLLNTRSKVKAMTQVAIGINFLHSKDIVHRDIKPGNAVVKSMPQGKALVKLGDFGLV